jgi:hypothetical protein
MTNNNKDELDLSTQPQPSTQDNQTEPVVQQDKPKAKIKLPIVTREFELLEEFSEPLSDKNKQIVETVPLPSEYTENIPSLLKGKNPPTDVKTTEWAETLTAASQTAGVENVFISSLKKEDATFRQGVETPSGNLSIEIPKLKRVDNQILDGEKAVLMARNLFGLGTVTRVPLFHSGFWITLKAPSDAQLLELNRQLTSDKIELGRQSYGLAFSNQNIFYSSRIFELVKACIHSHSIKTDKDISNFIYAHDLPIIIWGLACSVWPNGFNYSRSCMVDPDECQHVVTEKLNLSKLLWTNTSALNSWQKSHMNNRNSGSMSEDDVIRYRKELLNNQAKKITLDVNGESFSINMKTPNVLQWISQGTSWINNIVESATTAISSTASVNERNNYMINVAKTETLRQYSHWIDSIEIGSNRIEDRDSIESTLGALSGGDELREQIIKNIQTYIDETVVSLIGIPTYNCPKCEAPQEAKEPLPRFVNIIPLEVYTIFFILLMQRISRIAMR